MIRAYSQRILPPYTGVVQIAESARARAQSFDGVNWNIHYTSGVGQSNQQQERQQGYALDRGYYHVGSVHDRDLKPYIVPTCLDTADVGDSLTELYEFLHTARIPFPAADQYEYWLLDGADESPLALIFSCCEEAQMSTYPAQTEWTAIPHSKMKIDNTAGEQARNEPPVNHRFQRLIARRAGMRPRTAWFKRSQDDAGSFPGSLVREDWQDQAEHDLCQRYIQRKAPRLLMLQGLTTPDRERLEIAAGRHAVEVEEYFPLYPEIVDQDRMSAIRVEARLRRHHPQQTRVKEQDGKSKDAPMSKDMRIIEN